MSRKWISNLKGLGDNSALLAGFGPHLLKQALALCRALPRPFGNPGSIGSGHHVASSPSLLSPWRPSRQSPLCAWPSELPRPAACTRHRNTGHHIEAISSEGSRSSRCRGHAVFRLDVRGPLSYSGSHIPSSGA